MLVLPVMVSHLPGPSLSAGVFSPTLHPALPLPALASLRINEIPHFYDWAGWEGSGVKFIPVLVTCHIS